MTRLSIVIPMNSAGAPFEQTLASVLGNRPDDCQVIVPTPGPYDDPYELAEEVEFVAAGPLAGFVELVNAGFQRARGDIVHVLGCGFEVSEQWTEPALARFDDAKVGSVSPLVVRLPDGARVAAAGLRIGVGLARKFAAAGKRASDVARRRTRIAGPTIEAAFYRRAAIEQVCGADPLVGPDFCDLDLSLRLARSGFTAQCEPASRVLGDVKQSASARSFGEARDRERFFWRHNDSILAIAYHAWLVSVEAMLNLPRGRTLSVLTGRVWGLVCSPWDQRRRRRDEQDWRRDEQPAVMSEPEPTRSTVRLAKARAAA